MIENGFDRGAEEADGGQPSESFGQTSREADDRDEGDAHDDRAEGDALDRRDDGDGANQTFDATHVFHK